MIPTAVMGILMLQLIPIDTVNRPKEVNDNPNTKNSASTAQEATNFRLTMKYSSV